MCRKCFGSGISKGRKIAKKPRLIGSAHLDPTDPIAVSNRALAVINGKRPSASPITATIHELLRRGIAQLSAAGIELESVHVKDGKIKTVYRIEEETDL